MIWSTKNKSLKSSSNKKKTNSKTSWPELPTTWKDNLSIPKKNKALKSLLKLKHLKRTTAHNSLFWKMRFQSSRPLTLTRTMNLKLNYKKTETWKIDTKANSRTWLEKMIPWEKEFWSLKRWTKPRSRIYNKNTAIFMSRALPAWRNSIKDKSDFSLKKSTEKNGSLLKKILKFSTLSEKKETNNLHSRTESWP